MEMLHEPLPVVAAATNRSLRSRASSCEPLPVVAVAASYKLRAPRYGRGSVNGTDGRVAGILLRNTLAILQPAYVNPRPGKCHRYVHDALEAAAHLACDSPRPCQGDEAIPEREPFVYGIFPAISRILSQ